jgi:putative Holliday junction resolvase
MTLSPGKSTSPATLLCFDFGTKRIGVAVGQTLTDTATPLEIITVRNNRPDWERIGALIGQWQPQALIVGSPLNMDGRRQPIGGGADAFARKLQGRYRLPVLRADERLSTVEARTRQRNSDAVDHVAAQVILEGWLQVLAAGWRRGQKML